MKHLSTLKTCPDLSPQLEEGKRREFEGLLDSYFSAIEKAGMLKESYTLVERGDVVYNLINTLYCLFSDDSKDFGWMVSFEGAEGFYSEDIMMDNNPEDYSLMTQEYSRFDIDDFDLHSRQGVFKAFWNILAKILLQGIPLEEQSFREHIKRGVISMFTGEHYFLQNLSFELRYVEHDHESGDTFTTDNLYPKQSYNF